jgi:hypothetical protein
MATTRIDLIDSSLMRIGAQPMQSESAPNAEQQLAIYDSITGYCLSANPWSWNTVTRPLARLSEAPARYWSYQYELPEDRLGTPRAVFNAADCRLPFTGFELDDGVLKTNAAAIWLRHDKRSQPIDWPGYFQELIQVALMAEFALSVREDRTLRDSLHQQAFGTPSEMRQGGLMGVAMGIDAQAKPSPVLNLGANPLIAARFGG